MASLARYVILIATLTCYLCACHDEGPIPIDMPDPTDTMDVDTMPVDTMPIDSMDVDTMDLDTMDMDTMDIDTMDIDTMDIDTMNMDTIHADTIDLAMLQAAIDETKGTFTGFCYFLDHDLGEMGFIDFYDTAYNKVLTIQDIAIDSNGLYGVHAVMVIPLFPDFTFYLPDHQFIRDSVSAQQVHQQLIYTRLYFELVRSQGTLFTQQTTYDQFGPGYSRARCYWQKQ